MCLYHFLKLPTRRVHAEQIYARIVVESLNTRGADVVNEKMKGYPAREITIGALV